MFFFLFFLFFHFFFQGQHLLGSEKTKIQTADLYKLHNVFFFLFFHTLIISFFFWKNFCF
ncbi:MAG: hypothetical protein CO140_04645 [Candidatus Moranbacteria bacterium CG_4_9_14_3_um_filter_40_7]|nr:MAG: hypothetical protein COS71_02375 [Candidatus Moranbacteria bacterium CG06_land_8_20_14_3_00_40_12]PJA87373.1 MAG: hypothetical protein CO140_04645 [Candidatus Moranbacteria bacterium CG_4_9_14_3_um_filter_40_7]